MTRMKGHEQNLVAFLQNHPTARVHLLCGVSTASAIPITFFDSKVIKFLAQFNAELSVDFIIVAPDD